MYLILSNKGWSWCPVNTVYSVRVNFLDTSVLSVPTVCVVCWLRLSQELSTITCRKFKRKIDPMIHIKAKPLVIAIDGDNSFTEMNKLSSNAHKRAQIKVCCKKESVSIFIFYFFSFLREISIFLFVMFKIV